MWASQRLIVPKGYRLQLLKRYKDTKYTNGILIRDKQTGIRKPDIEERITPPKVNDHSIYWVIDQPVLGYQYVLPFIAVEEKAVTSRSK